MCMPNKDERKERLSDLGKAAIGIGAAAAFFTKSQFGRELASSGVSHLRSAFLKTSEEMRGQTLKSMWGHGAEDLKRAASAFKEGFQDTAAPNHVLPMRKNNLIGALAKRQEMAEHGEKYITQLFNKERFPEILKNTLREVTDPTNKEMQLHNYEIIDDLVTRRDKNISSEIISDNLSIPVFTEAFQQKLNRYYGEQAEAVNVRLMRDLANLKAHQERYRETYGRTVLENIQQQFNDYETYATKFKQDTFWNNLIGQQSATVEDILNHREQFQEQRIGQQPIVDLLSELVAQDDRFKQLIVDPTLKYVNGEFYSYQALAETAEAAEDSFLNNVGRIIKPLEVHRHIRQSPDFFLTPKGFVDEKLQARLEPGGAELQHSYLRLFDKTYRINTDGTLEHMAQVTDSFYLTPSKGFEGQQLRHIAGNMDYNLSDTAPLAEGDWLGQLKKRLGFVGPVSHSYDKEIKRAQRNQRLMAQMGIDETAFSDSFDEILTGLTHKQAAPADNLDDFGIHGHIRTLLKDIDQDPLTVLPSKRGLEAIQQAGIMPRAQNRMALILSDDQTLLDRILQMDPNRNNNADLAALIESYQKNPIEALERQFYHGARQNDFMTELRQELFKDAAVSSDLSNHMGHFVGALERAGLSNSDLTKAKQLTYFSQLQQASGIGLKLPNVVSDVQINSTLPDIAALFTSTENQEMQSFFKQVAQDRTQTHLAETFKEAFLEQHVAIARRPVPYVYMEKGINVLDILQGLNESLLEGGKRALAYAGQTFAGRNHLDDVTTQTLYPYFGLFRLQNDLKKTRLNLGQEDMGSVTDLAKNIILKRALPIYALGIGASYLNDEAEHFLGKSFTEMAAEATAKVDLGARKIIDSLGFSNALKDAYYWFTPLNYLQEQPYQDAEERKTWYESGYSPVKQSKFWTLGSSEFFGGRTLYYQPNYVKRAQTNWKDIGLYGSSEEKWKHSLIPTPTHPLSTIRYLMNPYWLEEKHQYDRPYMVSGPMFDPNTPWGAVGNLTLGNLIKPQKRLNRPYVTSRGIDVRNIIEAENEKIKDKARSAGALSIVSSDTAIETASPSATIDYQGGVPGNGVLAHYQGPKGAGMSGYVARQDYQSTHFSLLDKMQIYASNLQYQARNRVLNQIERMNYAIKEKAKWSYGNDTRYYTDLLNLKVSDDNTLVHHKEVAADLRNLTSNQDMIKDLTYSISQLSGIYNFIGESVLPRSKRFAYARSSDMYAASNRFWESGIDGADYGGMMEIIRRFIPHEDRNRIRVNPLRNNMPSWMPDRLKLGDPYASIKKGEMRLPGKGYEALYGLADKSSFKINADIIGLNAESIISRTISDNREWGLESVSEYQEALLASGQAIAINQGIADPHNNVFGTYDALIHDPNSPEGRAVLQLKVLDDASYQQLAANGAARQDLANVNYYVGQEHLSKGYVTYINKTSQQMTTFDVNFSQVIYQESLHAVREARQKLTESVKKGVLSPYELYDDMTRFKILADVAPGSAEYKNYKKMMQGNLATEADKKEFEATLERVEKQSQKHRFFNYKFAHVKVNQKTGIIESIDNDAIKLVGDDTVYQLAGLKNYNEKIYRYLAPGEKVRMEYEASETGPAQYVKAAVYNNGLNINRQMAREGSADRSDDGSAMATRAMLTHHQIAMGAPFEMLAHLPIPILHNKFLKVETPYESWMRENIYGTKFSTWNHPIQTILKPSFQQAWGASLTQGLMGTGLFALNEYVSDLAISKGRKTALKVAHLALTPGAFAGEITERVLTLNFGKHSTGTGARIGTVVGLTGMMLANAQNPFVAAFSGAGMGYTLSKFLDQTKSGKTAALLGTAAGLAVSALKTDGLQLNQLNQKYVPKAVKKRWELEEYFDRLEYLKYKGLFEKAARLAYDKEGVSIKKILSDMADRETHTASSLSHLNLSKDSVMHSALSQQTKNALLEKINNEIELYANPNVEVPATPYVRLAMGYRQAMASTVYGLDENSSWAQTLRALEPYERDYFLEFAKETNPHKQKQILKSIAPYKRKILENAWGRQKKTKIKSNARYFKSHRLPGPLWQGWNAETDLDNYKVKTIENEGMLLSDFGYYDSEKDKPEVRQATPIVNYDEGNALFMRTNLLSVMNGLGITDSEISVLPSQRPGIQTLLNIGTVQLQKYKTALQTLGAQFY